MQSLKLQTFKNAQTGNIAEILINGSDMCVYYQENCLKGIVRAGHDQDDMFWASWSNENGLTTLTTNDWPCLDDALNGLESIIETELQPQLWYSDNTGF